ncbi:MAG: hypothetical protein RLZZ31_7 [Actinomycetota bacterium]
MELTVLGCSGSYPGSDCACSGYVISHDHTNVLVDFGPGCLANLQKHFPLDSVAGVVLSHSHADHWSDLAVFHVAGRYQYAFENLPVYGTQETLAIAQLMPGNLEPTFAWEVIGDGAAFSIGPFQFHTEQTDHYVETMAMRIDCYEGPSIFYSADTGPEWSANRLAHNVDLAIIESTYETDDDVAEIKHLSATMAGEMGRAVGAKRLLLTHFWPGTDRVKHFANGSAAYGADVELAYDNLRMTV